MSLVIVLVAFVTISAVSPFLGVDTRTPELLRDR